MNMTMRNYASCVSTTSKRPRVPERRGSGRRRCWSRCKCRRTWRGWSLAPSPDLPQHQLAKPNIHQRWESGVREREREREKERERKKKSERDRKRGSARPHNIQAFTFTMNWVDIKMSRFPEIKPYTINHFIQVSPSCKANGTACNLHA